tara:strand:+ start:95 stop:3562 length:3468 start_codon:yes stop_codon:yes gene_type:complete
MDTINTFCTEKHKEYRDKCILSYKIQRDRYDLSGKTNQKIGKEYYELLCAVDTNMILHDDLPTEFLAQVLKNVGLQEFGDIIDPINRKYTHDIGGDIYDLIISTIGQCKYGYTTSSITLNSLSHTNTAKEIYGLKNCVLCKTTDAKLHYLTNLILNKWLPTKIIDIEPSILQTISIDNSQKLLKNEESDKIKARPWQNDCMVVIDNEKYVNLQAPPGAGKGSLFILDLKKHYNDGKAVLYFVPRRDLAVQMKKLILRYLPELSNRTFIFGDDNKIPTDIPNNAIIICVVASAKHIPSKLKFKSVWKDEAHLHKELEIEKYDSEKYIQMSATMSKKIKLNYHYPLPNAIKDKCIVDYQLRIVAITDGDLMEACCKYACENPQLYPMQMFFNRVDRLKIAKEIIEKYESSNGLRKPSVKIITGDTNKDDREIAKKQLESGELDILLVCGCFNVGTDLPRLLSTFVVDKKQTREGLLQAAMRCLRNHFTKNYGNIIIPVHTNNDSDTFTVDESDELKFVIKCLREHDERLYDEQFLRLQTRIDSDTKKSRNTDSDNDLQMGIFSFEKFIKIVRIDEDKKAIEFVQIVEDDERIPTTTDIRKFSDDCVMGYYWHDTKRRLLEAGNTLKSHHKILLKNPILKEDFERYKTKKSKPILTYDEKATELDNIVNTDNKIPTGRPTTRRFSDGTQLICFWEKEKRKLLEAGNKLKSYQKILLNNPILKKDFERYKQDKEKEKPPPITYDEKATEFVKIVEDGEKIPYKSNTGTFSDGTKVGHYWPSYIKKILKAGNALKSHHKILLNNPILKKSFEKYKKDQQKEKPQSITEDEKAIECVAFVEADGRKPSQSDDRQFTDGVRLGCYISNMWKKAYNLQKEGKEYYSHHKILLNNQILKDDFEKYKTRQEKSITDDEKATIFVKIVENDEAVPAGHRYETRTFSDGSKISNYWEYQKRSMLQLLKAKKEYQSNHKILLNNPLLKEDFEKYKKNNEISITDNEKATEYVKLVNANGKILTKTSGENTKFSDASNTGYYWSTIRKTILKAEKENKLKSHHKILLNNQLLKEYFKKYKTKEETKKPPLTYNEKATEYVQTIEADGKIPIAKDERRFTDGTKIGYYWHAIKSTLIKAGNALKSHHKILLNNQLLKEDFERHKNLCNID